MHQFVGGGELLDLVGIGLDGHALAQGEDHPHAAQQFQGRGDVAQVGHIGKVHLALGQQGTSQDRQGGILGPSDANLAVEPLAAPNKEFIHQKLRSRNGLGGNGPGCRRSPRG